jgi:TusA-related sulfurtransferase
MAQTIDARGLSCPEPVILAQQAIQKGLFPVEVLVDTVTARENVSRMAKHQGCTVSIISQDTEFKVVLRK